MSEERSTRRRGIQHDVRTAAVWSRVRDLAADRQAELSRPLRILDLGGGTGGLAVPLAQEGHSVTVVDPSADALASLHRRVSGAGGASGRIRAIQGDAEVLASLDLAGTVDLVCCHDTLELTDDPAVTLGSIAAVLTSGGSLSLVVAQRSAAVLSYALAGRLDQAREVLVSADGRWGEGDPMPRRFDRDGVLDLLGRAGFTPVEIRGVRLFSDLLPHGRADSESDRAALLELEDLAADARAHRGLSGLGSSLHLLARRD